MVAALQCSLMSVHRKTKIRSLAIANGSVGHWIETNIRTLRITKTKL
jgi:hypothetical protein